MAAPTTQAEALALTSPRFRAGTSRIIAKVANKRDVKCAACRRKVSGGALYFDVGLRAHTLYEKTHARRGLIWHVWCPKCAAE